MSIYSLSLHKQHLFIVIIINHTPYTRDNNGNNWSIDCCIDNKLSDIPKHYVWNQSHFEAFTVATMTWLAVMEYMCSKWPRICSIVVNTSRSFPHSWLITRFVTRLTRRVPLVEQELLNLSEHPLILVCF